jgi:phosphatidylglycerol:prolipoprotein diacylglycerol transferase
MLSAWLHDLSPFLWRFTDSFGFRWYGLSYAAGFVVAWLILRWLSRRGLTPVPEHRIPDAMLMLVGGVIVGGRLGYLLIYDRTMLTEFTSSPPFWGALAIQRGGMAYHGAVVGVMVAGWIISRGFKDSSKPGVRVGKTTWRHVMDLCGFSCTIGLGLGRLANFINGELLGKIVAMPGEAAPWWSVKFPQELLEGHAPTLSAEQQARLDALIASVAAPMDDREQAIARMIAILQEGGSTTATRIQEQLAPLIAARHPSQLYQAFFEGVVLTAALWLIWRAPRRPGVVGSWFLIIYGGLRIVAEFYRLPDAQFGASAHIMGLSRGQWLSVLMVVGGVAALAWIRRLGEARVGGWGKASGAAGERASG